MPTYSLNFPPWVTNATEESHPLELANPHLSILLPTVQPTQLVETTSVTSLDHG
jgi:hypothetical protein